jgi:transcriptional regulator with XRE-family HTH domain
MICTTSKEILVEIKKYMDLNDIPMKDLAARMNKSQQSVSQIFQIANPKISTLLEICNVLNLQIDINFKNKSDAN